MSDVIKKIAFGARIAAGLGLCLVAWRFAFVSQQAPAATSITSAAASVSSAAPPPPPPAKSGAPVPRAVASNPAPPGKLVRVLVMIDGGSDRSDVYVDDSLVGQSPFIGDIQCLSKENVHIKLVPARGKPLEFDRNCASGLTVDRKATPNPG